MHVLQSAKGLIKPGNDTEASKNGSFRTLLGLTVSPGVLPVSAPSAKRRPSRFGNSPTLSVCTKLPLNRDSYALT